MVVDKQIVTQRHLSATDVIRVSRQYKRRVSLGDVVRM